MIPGESDAPIDEHIRLAGQFDRPGEQVSRGVLRVVGDNAITIPDGHSGRLELARWLTDVDGGAGRLTARVLANRVWHHLIGRGIVRTVDNFGRTGEAPSHPELLDHMARELIDSGWSMKALVRQIVLSRTFAMSSRHDESSHAVDPENRLLARGPRFRLPAEVIRDQSLLLSGLLKNHIGGPSVFPYQTKDLYKGIVVAADYPGTKWVESTGDGLHRRSLYTFWKRTVPHPTMTVFDAPDREFCIVRRSTTNTPLQALTLLNDPIYVEASRKFAERAVREGGATPEARLAYAFRLATGRAPDAEETRVLLDTYARMPAEGYAAVANLILNLDEVITK